MVTDPAKFVPLWVNFSKSIEKYDWTSNGYGLQTHYLGNNGTGITHEIWASFNTVQDALAFLSGLNNSKEFADIYVFNTCSVTENANKETRKLIRREKM